MMKVVVYLTDHVIVGRIIDHVQLSFVLVRSRAAAHFARTLSVISDGYLAV